MGSGSNNVINDTSLRTMFRLADNAMENQRPTMTIGKEVSGIITIRRWVTLGKRSTPFKNANLAARQELLDALKREFGVEEKEDLPASVLKALKLSNFESTKRPLTARRIAAISKAVTEERQREEVANGFCEFMVKDASKKRRDDAGGPEGVKAAMKAYKTFKTSPHTVDDLITIGGKKTLKSGNHSLSSIFSEVKRKDYVKRFRQQTQSATKYDWLGEMKKAVRMLDAMGKSDDGTYAGAEGNQFVKDCDRSVFRMADSKFRVFKDKDYKTAVAAIIKSLTGEDKEIKYLTPREKAEVALTLSVMNQNIESSTFVSGNVLSKDGSRVMICPLSAPHVMLYDFKKDPDGSMHFSMFRHCGKLEKLEICGGTKHVSVQNPDRSSYTCEDKIDISNEEIEKLAVLTPEDWEATDFDGTSGSKPIPRKYDVGLKFESWMQYDLDGIREIENTGI